MQYRTLGRTGVRVSPMCLGTMTFGADTPPDEAARMYGACRERGINFFDCADGYNAGRAEEVLGTLIADHRDDVVLTTKCFNPTSRDVNARGASRRHVGRAVEASLRRLGTDRVDILFMHRFDPVVPLDETLRGLEDLVRAGKVLYLGASNYAAWQVAKALGISARNGWSRFEAIQPMYNLVKRQVESEILPMAASESVGVMTYSPLGGGLLAGKYGSATRPNAGRLVDNKMYAKRYGESWGYETAGHFTDFAAERGVHPATLAVAWVASHPAITAPIIGGRTLEQLEPSLEALDMDMSDELRAEISALSREPAPATDRLEERA